MVSGVRPEEGKGAGRYWNAVYFLGIFATSKCNANPWRIVWQKLTKQGENQL
jgi:hypothetical protein